MTPSAAAPAGTEPILSVSGLRLRRGGRTLVDGLDLDLAPGEFLAVLGPNGAGKSSLIEAALGTLTPDAGSITVDGRPPGSRRPRIGYIPQQRTFDPGLTLRGRDLVQLGVDGHRWGPGLPGRRRRRDRVVDEALAAFEATELGPLALGRMSGGQQQRVRAAQALAGDPALLLCDEPLLSLDLPGQRTVASVLDARRREHGTAVLFVTHEINPVLSLVDRVLYLVDGRHRVGTPEEVLTSASLTELFGTPVEVVSVRGRLVVVADEAHVCTEPGAAGHHPEEP